MACTRFSNPSYCPSFAEPYPPWNEEIYSLYLACIMLWFSLFCSAPLENLIGKEKGTRIGVETGVKVDATVMWMWIAKETEEPGIEAGTSTPNVIAAMTETGECLGRLLLNPLVLYSVTVSHTTYFMI